MNKLKHYQAVTVNLYVYLLYTGTKRLDNYGLVWPR